MNNIIKIIGVIIIAITGIEMTYELGSWLTLGFGFVLVFFAQLIQKTNINLAGFFGGRDYDDTKIGFTVKNIGR